MMTEPFTRSYVGLLHKLSRFHWFSCPASCNKFDEGTYIYYVDFFFSIFWHPTSLSQRKFVYIPPPKFCYVKLNQSSINYRSTFNIMNSYGSEHNKHALLRFVSYVDQLGFFAEMALKLQKLTTFSKVLNASTHLPYPTPSS